MATYNIFDLGADLPSPGIAASAFAIPVTSGLVGLWAGLDGAAALPVNLADGSAGYTVGDPTESSGVVTLPAGAYIDPDIADTQAMTLLILAKKPSASDPAGFIGSYTGLYTGVALFSSAGETTMQYVVGKTSGSALGFITSTITSWGLYALVIPATGSCTLHNLTGGYSTSSTNADARVAATGQMLIGGLPTEDAGLRGACNIGLAAQWSKALSSEELSLVSAWGKSYAAAHGITA